MWALIICGFIFFPQWHVHGWSSDGQPTQMLQQPHRARLLHPKGPPGTDTHQLWELSSAPSVLAALNQLSDRHVAVCLGCHNRILWMEIYLSIVLEAPSPRSGCQHGCVLLRALLLVCRRPPSHHILTWPFLDVCTWRQRASISSYEATPPIRAVSAPVNHSNPN